MPFGVLLPGLGEERREGRARIGFLGLLSLLQRLVEGRILAVAAHGAHNLNGRYFERDVHAALQVEAEAELALAHFAVGEGPENRARATPNRGSAGAGLR